MRRFSAFAFVMLAFPAPGLAAASERCLRLVATVEERALEVFKADGNVSDMIQGTSKRPEERDARACRAARDVIAKSQKLKRFADTNKAICQTESEKRMFDLAVSMGSATTANSLLDVLCK